MAMSAARVIALFLIAGLLTSPIDLSSCGPFLLTAVFTLSRQPDQPDTSFAHGQLGILLPSFYRWYLAVAYRHLTGVGVNESERAAFFPTPVVASGPGPQWIREWNTSISPSEQDWLEARKKVPGAPPPSKIVAYRRDTTPNTYTEYVNCGDDAFDTAASTLQARQAKFTASEMQDWLRGQDDVFSNCSGGAVIPSPAPDGNALLQADRAYQIAAANFYAGNFDQAESQFRSIAQDQNSPWRALSTYLLARCNIRRATLTNKPDAMTQAESGLEAILKDASLKPVQPAAASLLNFVHARRDPERRLHELSQSILARSAAPSLAQDFTDYMFLFYKRDNRADAPDDLTDWLATFRAPLVASDHALQRWRETQSFPWLVAAITQARAGDAATSDLLEAAGKIQPDSPAYATVAFHAVRLLEESKQAAEARRRLDTILASRSKYPSSAVNLFLAERMRESESWQAFLKYAPRVPVGSGYDYDGESPSDFNADPQLKAFAGGRPVFDADASTILSEQVPLSLLKDASTRTLLPATLRAGIATAAGARRSARQRCASPRACARCSNAHTRIKATSHQLPECTR